MARQMTPRSISSCAARAPTLPGWAKPAGERFGRELEPAHQAEAPGLADQRVAGEAVEVGGEARGEAADAGRHVDALVDLDRLDRRRRRRPGGRRRCSRGRGCRSCRSSPRSPRPCRASIATAESGRKPAVSCLAIESGVRLEAERLGAEPLAGAAEAADHLVGDHQDVVPAADGVDRPRSNPRAAR